MSKTIQAVVNPRLLTKANRLFTGSLEVQIGKELHSDYVWSGTLTCVDALTVTAHANDRRSFSSAVCMAIAPPPDQDPRCLEDLVLVTPGAERLRPGELWYHLGGWSDEGDTYDTQQAQFEEALDHFWASLRGPDEHLRCRLLAAADQVDGNWKSILIQRGGAVRIRLADRQVKTITIPNTAP